MNSNAHLFFKVSVAGATRSVGIAWFDGVQGRLSANAGNEISGLNFVEILDPNSNKALWSGDVFFRSDEGSTSFSLCVDSSSGKINSEILSWSKLPEFFSILDGGYQALNADAVSELLSDLITFGEVTDARLHCKYGTETVSCNVTLGRQDELKNLSEVFVSLNTETYRGIGAGTLAILQVELFELSYCLICPIAEALDEGFILTLTSHVYSQRRRIAKRRATSLTFGAFSVNDVSDSGVAAEVSSPLSPEVGSTIRLPLSESSEAEFRVVYTKEISPARHRVGLAFCDSEAGAIDSWLALLLRIHYPRLQRRSSATREKVWELLGKSGYLDNDFGRRLQLAKQAVYEEWDYIDSAGPMEGECVVGMDGDDAVGTISISRVTDTCWTAQAAAAIDDPRYLPITRSFYAWRTKAILQRPHSLYHIAFFARDKPFLDRFFRKFFLHYKDIAGDKLTWDEWRAIVISKPSDSPAELPEVEIGAQAKAVASRENLFRQFSEENRKKTVTAVFEGNVIALIGRPFVHICQYFSSLWLCDDNPQSIEVSKKLANRHFPTSPAFYLLRTKSHTPADTFSELDAKNSPTDDGWEVVWLCHRDYLDRFLSNSLRALELMVRKYGVQRSA